MSEQIEIEVGVNTQNFQNAINSIQKNLKGLGNTTARIRVDGLDKGLIKLSASAEDGRKKALTLKDAFRQIGSQRISTASIKDITEITREFLRIVKELGPVITLAMNALDRPLRKAVLSFVDLLTQVERANSNFLVLRKVLPIRFFTQLAVNAQRVQTSVKGMAKDFKDFGDRGGKAIDATLKSLRKLLSTSRSGASNVGKLVGQLTDGKLGRASRIYDGLTKSVQTLLRNFRGIGQALSVTTRQFAQSNAIVASLGNAFTQIKSKIEGFVSSTSKLIPAVSRVTRESTIAGKALRAFNTTGVAVAMVGVKALIATTGILVTSLGRLIGLNASKPFELMAKSAQLAGASIRNVTTAIAKISTSPITAVGKAFKGLGSVLQGSMAGITTAIAGITALGLALGKVANGAVANYRKEWKKVVSELPQETKGSSEAIRASLKDLQNELGLLSEDALPALQRSLQIGFDGNASIDLLRQASQLAIAEITTLEGGVELLGNTMRSFSGQSLTAQEAVDKLFTASKAGGVNLQDLGRAIQQIGPDIGATGIAFDDFSASLSVLVRSGRLTFSALRDIASLSTAIVAPSEESANAMTQLGVEFGKGALQAKGLSGVLSDIIDASGGSTAVMELLLGSQENLNTAFTLGQNNGDAFAKALDRVANSAGSASEQASEIDSSFKRAIRRARVTVEGLMIELGELMTPAIESLNKFVTEYTQKIKNVVKLGIQLFKDGNIGEFLKLSIAVGLDKASVAFQNFATKAYTALVAGGTEAMAQIIALAPDLGEGLSLAWEYLKINFVKSVGNMLGIADTFVNYFVALFKKGIQEAGELWASLFGGNVGKAQDFNVILQQEIDKGSTTRTLGAVFGGLANKMEEDLASALSQDFAGKLVPALKEVAEATKNAYVNTKGSAIESEKTADNIGKMKDFLATASKNLTDADTGTKETSKQLANANQLLALGKTGGDGLGGGGGGGLGGQLGETIASTIQRVGGGGNVMESQNITMKSLVGLGQQQIAELKLLNRGLTNLNLGEVAP